MCHICGHIETAPKKCPETKCGNVAIRFSGLGTEKVEAALEKGFPSARVKRMDSDTLKRKEDYRRILGDFRTGKIDILVGTQMIAARHPATREKSVVASKRPLFTILAIACDPMCLM